MCALFFFFIRTHNLSEEIGCHVSCWLNHSISMSLKCIRKKRRIYRMLIFCPFHRNQEKFNERGCSLKVCIINFNAQWYCRRAKFNQKFKNKITIKSYTHTQTHALRGSETIKKQTNRQQTSSVDRIETKVAISVHLI